MRQRAALNIPNLKLKGSLQGSHWTCKPVRLPDAFKYPSTLQASTTTDGGLETFPEAGSPGNIGILLVRKTANAFAKVCLQPLMRGFRHPLLLSCRTPLLL